MSPICCNVNILYRTALVLNYKLVIITLTCPTSKPSSLHIQLKVVKQPRTYQINNKLSLCNNLIKCNKFTTYNWTHSCQNVAKLELRSHEIVTKTARHMSSMGRLYWIVTDNTASRQSTVPSIPNETTYLSVVTATADVFAVQLAI